MKLIPNLPAYISRIAGKLFPEPCKNHAQWAGDLQYWRDRILSATLLCGIIFAFIPYAQGMVLAFEEKTPGIAIVDTVVYGIAVGLFIARRIGFEIRAIGTIGILYAVGLTVLIYRGPVTSGLIYLLAFSFFGGILLGLRTAVLTLVINALTLVAMGRLIGTGQLSWAVDLAISPGKWLVTSLNFLFLSGAGAISTAVLAKGLQASLLKERITSQELEKEVAERKRTEEALSLSEERFRLAMQGANDGLWDWDLKTDAVYYSPRWKSMLGYAENELQNHLNTWKRIVHPDDLEATLSKVCELLDGRIDKFEAEFRLQHKDGRWLHILSRAFLVHRNEGEAVRLVGTHVDITERKQAEERWLQAQKMESVGRLAGGVAHDFNNMLGVIIGYTELALDMTSPGDPRYLDLQEVQKAARRSADLVRQLLAFARKQAASPKVLDLNQAISGMIMMLRRLTGEDIDLIWTPGRDLWKVKADPSQIDQILANLTVNARDAIPGTGVISLRTENFILDDSAIAVHEGVVDGDYVLLTVSDNGTGMTGEIIEHLFEPFFTTRAVGKGTGLGLATVYGIVRQNNGFIGVSSQPGQGSTFRVYLPRFEAGTPEAESESYS